MVPVPELRIVDDALWDRVKARQQQLVFEVGRDEAGNTLNLAHRHRFLLSGLLECGACGAGYTIMAKDRYGCAGHRSTGAGANDRTVTRPEIEARVLDGLKTRTHPVSDAEADGSVQRPVRWIWISSLRFSTPSSVRA